MQLGSLLLCAAALAPVSGWQTGASLRLSQRQLVRTACPTMLSKAEQLAQAKAEAAAAKAAYEEALAKANPVAPEPAPPPPPPAPPPRKERKPKVCGHLPEGPLRWYTVHGGLDGGFTFFHV